MSSRTLSLLLMLLGAALPALAQAELWGYVDGRGVAHLSSQPLNGQYALVLGDADVRHGRVTGKTDGSQGLLTWLEIAPEVKSVQPFLREAAARHGVDMELLKAVIAVESGYRKDAVSPRGAVGLMQLSPDSARPFMASAAATVEQRLLDPRTNVLAGAGMLADLLKKFGRIDVALAAWNAGEGTVRRHGGGMPPIDETRAHVHLVLELYWALLQRNLPRQAHQLKIHAAPRPQP